MIDINLQTLLVQLANFLIIWMVLDLILYRPIRGIIKKRSQLMREQMDAIEKFTAEAETKMTGYTAALDAARKVGTEERTRLRQEGAETEAAIVAEASKDASATVQAARQEIDAEVKGARKTLDAQVQTMAKKATDKVLGAA